MRFPSNIEPKLVIASPSRGGLAARASQKYYFDSAMLIQGGGSKSEGSKARSVS